MKFAKNVLPLEKAEALRQAFIDAEYRTQQQAESCYYKKEIEGFPAPDETYFCRYRRSTSLEKSELFTESVKGLHGYFNELGKRAKFFAYKMEAGDEFRMHDDLGNGIGFVYYLSKGWEWDWGGILNIVMDNGVLPVLPRFNTLVVIDHGRAHWVSPVSDYAKEPRYAVVGFILEN